MEEIDDYESLPSYYPFAVHMLAGASAGIAEHAVIFPVDTIKTRLQVPTTFLSNVTTSPLAPSSIASMYRSILGTDGWMGFWRGFSSVVIAAGPAHALYFATYEFSKLQLNSSSLSNLGSLCSGLAGASATIVHDLLLTPFDVIKQRMQLGYASMDVCHHVPQSPQIVCSGLSDSNMDVKKPCKSFMHDSRRLQYSSIGHCFSHTYRKEGISAFFVSLPTTLMMNIPFHTIHFGVYDFLQGRLRPVFNGYSFEKGFAPMLHITCGAVAGGTAALLTTPLDVAKTLLQTRGVSPCVEIRNCNSLFKAWRILYHRDGIKSFWHGGQARIIAHAPATAISWSVYEYFKWLMNNPMRERSRMGRDGETDKLAVLK